MKIVIPGRIPSKKNSKRIVMFGKRPAIIGSKDYLSWKESAGWEVQSQLAHIKSSFGILPLEGPVRIDIDIYSENRRAGDLSNKEESLMDLLVDQGIIKDDNWFVVSEKFARFIGIDKNNPRAEISILLLG